MNLTHPNRCRHDRRVAARRSGVENGYTQRRAPWTLPKAQDKAEAVFARIERKYGVEGTEVRIAKDDRVPSRYRGTKATIINVVRPEAPEQFAALDHGFDHLVVKVQAYRRKSPLVIRLVDLIYPTNAADVIPQRAAS